MTSSDSFELERRSDWDYGAPREDQRPTRLRIKSVARVVAAPIGVPTRGLGPVTGEVLARAMEAHSKISAAIVAEGSPSEAQTH